MGLTGSLQYIHLPNHWRSRPRVEYKTLQMVRQAVEKVSHAGFTPCMPHVLWIHVEYYAITSHKLGRCQNYIRNHQKASFCILCTQHYIITLISDNVALNSHQLVSLQITHQGHPSRSPIAVSGSGSSDSGEVSELRSGYLSEQLTAHVQYSVG